VHPPEMRGNVKLSSDDPRSRRIINISAANVNLNPGRNIPSTATPLTRPGTTAMANKPNKPPAPIFVGSPLVACLTPPYHSQVINIMTSIADRRDETTESESEGGASEGGRCETIKRLARCQRET